LQVMRQHPVAHTVKKQDGQNTYGS
jgi:hypothetical protein